MTTSRNKVKDHPPPGGATPTLDPCASSAIDWVYSRVGRRATYSRMRGAIGWAIGAGGLLMMLVGCGASPSGPSADLPVTTPSVDGSGPLPGEPPGEDGSPSGDGGSPVTCLVTTTDTGATPLAKATAGGEYTLTLEAASASKTSWAEKGNEAVVLEVLRGGKRVSHVVLHQGQDRFTYGIHVGALAAGEELSVRVSPLTAAKATKSACVSKIALTPVAGADAEGTLHAPVFVWPKGKAFDDLPILVGWSKGGKGYQLTYTNENGGTVALCGGGAKGMKSEIARWGRGLDMEGGYSYGGAGSFGRCPGAGGTGLPRLEAAHPVLYYGDGHNRLFESRGGYGQACGTSSDNRADGDQDGWNANNPGNEPEKDDPFTIVLRPLPVSLDDVGYRQYGGRREGIVDTYAPWLYRLVDSELAREGKIDGTQTLPMTRYLFVDVYAADVGGSGDSSCGFGGVSGGFVLRAVTAGGIISNGPQMTVDYFGAQTPGVKRIAVPLAAGVTAKDITKLVFDAYDNDGIYLLGIGDAFIPQPSGTNGATLDFVIKGVKKVGAYVDDGNSGCVNGKNTNGGVEYPCVGGAMDVVVP
jgi:hypothetical protein